MKKAVLIAAAGAALLLSGCKGKQEENAVSIGLLHSLSGTMAISETPVRDSEMLAIREINEAGGVLGKKIRGWRKTGQATLQPLQKRHASCLKKTK